MDITRLSMHRRPLQVWQETRMWQPHSWLNANQGTAYVTVLRNISPLFCYNIVHSSDSVCLLSVCRDLLEKMWVFLGWVITGDETWVFQYDLETKRQSLQLKTQNSPRAKKAHMTKSKIKVMLIAFFDQRGEVHHEFVPQGQTVNQQFYRGSSTAKMTGFGTVGGLCGETSHGCSTMTCPHTQLSLWGSSRPTNRSQLSTTLLLSHRMTSGSSQGWRPCSKEPFCLCRTDQGHRAEGPQRGFCNRTFVIKPFWEKSCFFIVRPHEVKYYF